MKSLHVSFQNILELKKNLSHYEDKLGSLDQTPVEPHLLECSKSQVNRDGEAVSNHIDSTTVPGNPYPLDEVVKGHQPRHLSEVNVSPNTSDPGSQPNEQTELAKDQDVQDASLEQTAGNTSVDDVKESREYSTVEVSNGKNTEPLSQTDELKTSRLGSKELKIDIPTSISALNGEEDTCSLEVARSELVKDPTGCLSPKSYSVFKDFLTHTPDMNLPWQSMRLTSQCSCGVSFSYSHRKVGSVILHVQ